MMGHRERLKGGDEYDAFTKWRRCLHWRSGEIKKIKRGYHKRVRKEHRRHINTEVQYVQY